MATSAPRLGAAAQSVGGAVAFVQNGKTGEVFQVLASPGCRR